MTLNAQTLLAELDTTLSEVSQDWRTAVLRQIADMFFNSAELYSKDQVALFDPLMSLLLPGVDRPTLAELSNRLTGAPLPPPKVLASLANHPDLEVCGPVLERSKALPDKVLVEVADRERIEHSILAKIAAREQLDETVTDSLLKRATRPSSGRSWRTRTRAYRKRLRPRDHGHRRRQEPRADGGGTPGSAR